MTIEMRALSAEQLLKGNDIKGIANASNWENAYPVTLAGIIEEALNNHPEILWLMPDGDPEQKVQEYETGAISAEAIRKDVLRGPIENMNLNQPADIAAEEFARGLKEGLEAVDVDSRQVEEEPDQGEEENENQEEPSILEKFKAVKVVSEDVKAGSEEPKKEEDSSEVPSPRKSLGVWADYMGRALSTAEQNKIIKGMTEEHYPMSQIARVVRLSQPTICNRKKRMKEEGELS